MTCAFVMLWLLSSCSSLKFGFLVSLAHVNSMDVTYRKDSDIGAKVYSRLWMIACSLDTRIVTALPGALLEPHSTARLPDMLFYTRC